MKSSNLAAWSSDFSHLLDRFGPCWWQMKSLVAFCRPIHSRSESRWLVASVMTHLVEAALERVDAIVSA